MRCLYCGKELALLKRLTGSEFCSDAHKQSYQDEYNRLALSRLLQAQPKPDESKNKAAKPSQAAKQSEWIPAPEPQPEIVVEPQPEPVREPVAARVEPEAELVSIQMTGFCDETRPLIRDMVFSERPITATPVELTSPPCIPNAPIKAIAIEASAPPRAELVPLELRPPALSSRQTRIPLETPAPHATNKEFAPASVDLNLRIQPASRHGLPSAPAVPIMVAAPVSPIPAAAHLDTAAEFALELEFRETARADLELTGIELPAEEAEVVVSEPVENLARLPETNGTPRDALQALARLHKAIQEENTPPDGDQKNGDGDPAWQDAEPAIDTMDLERLYGDGPVTPAYAAHQNQPVPERGGGIADNTPLEPAVAVSELEPALVEADAVPVGHVRGQMVAMPVKLFAPAKARLAPGFPALVHKPEPEIPASDASPLRPKMAINTSPIAKAKVEEPKASPVPEPSKAAVEAPPVAKPTVAAEKPGKNKAPVWTPAPKTTVRPLITKPPTPEPVKAQPQAPAAAKEPPAAPPLPKVSPPQPPPATAQQQDLSGPNLMLTNSGGSFWGGLPMTAKIAMGVVAAIVLAIVVYMASSGPKKSDTAASAAVAGPSIMMGEGGWVTGWAGDSTGLHRGRQITMYRPSLKLSDYRIEFQGRIVNNSMGWVFRSSDAGNYYAMKVIQTPSGYKLQKYAVIASREHDGGQVSLQAPTGGVFNIRVDIRGPRFSTYIQGQPVDIWTDNQLKTGGVGFLNDRGDRADIKGVSMSYLAGTGN